MNMIVLQSLCANKLDSWRPPAVIWCPTAAFVWWNWPHCRLVHFCRGMDLSACRWVHVGTGMDLPARTAWWLTAIVAGWADVGTEHTPRVCSAAQRSSRPDHWDSLMLDRSAVGQLSSLSSGTKWQRLPITLHTLRSVSPAGNHCRFVLLDKDESCPTADLSNIRQSQWYGLAYSTGELLNTPLDNGMDMMKTQPEGGGQKWIYHCYADERRICWWCVQVIFCFGCETC